jgi:hypothetical protein
MHFSSLLVILGVGNFDLSNMDLIFQLNSIPIDGEGLESPIQQHLLCLDWYMDVTPQNSGPFSVLLLPSQKVHMMMMTDSTKISQSPMIRSARGALFVEHSTQ